MIKAKPLSLAQKLKNIVDICEAADTEIEAQKLIQKGALDAGKENDGIEPAVVRKILARRKKLAKDPAETTRLEDLMIDYQFMLGEGREAARPWTQADDEISRVMALTNTSRPPKIEAIKKALGCSQGKAHKLRSMAAVRLAKKSSSSSDEREHEHSDHDADGVITETQEGLGPNAVPEETNQPLQAAPPAIESCGGVESRHAGGISGEVTTGDMTGGRPCGQSDLRAAAAETPAGVAPGPHDTAAFEAALDRVYGPDEGESPATPSVGAVADDDLDIPAHLRGPSPANRRVG